MSDKPDSGWGKGFPSSGVGTGMTGDGREIGFSIAGYKPIGGDRQNMEDQPNRVLTDSELRSADTVVVKFTDGTGYKTFASGPWEDWDELWDDIMDWYEDEY